MVDSSGAENGGSGDFVPPKRAQKAYLNPQFLKSRDARIVRMMCEYLEPLQRFQKLDVRETIVFFGSARARPPVAVKTDYEAVLEEKKKAGNKIPKALRARLAKLEADMKLSIYYEEAAELSASLTQWAKSLGQGKRFVICSGGGPGIMEAANRGASERAGGPTVGLAISLPNEERPNPFITPDLLFEFHYFFMRKLWFAYLACALVIFPGGFGTMDELFEILTLVQTRKIGRPLPIILYGKKFWGDFLDLQALVRWGTISAKDLNLFRICDSPKEAFEHLKKELARCYPKPQQWQHGTV
ncbi:MAG TPA: LOG family protein [Planctomycetota bacterium]|nr:LOG family protein [Planctomycetota bacterium]